MKLQIDPDRLLSYGARLIAALWAVFWIWLDLNSSLGKGLPLGGSLLGITVPSLFFTLLLFLAWRTEVLVGLLLLLFGALIAVAFLITSGHLPMNAVVFVVLTMALPPLAAGTMFLVDWRMKNPRIA